MKRHMAMGDFLVAYLRKIGATHVFGIPGDLALKLFFALGRREGPQILTFSHEPGVGFAADGYARATGKIGVICVTYGAGGHNMVNPVAGSFSERVPIADLLRRPRRGGAQARHADSSSGARDRIAASHLPGGHLRLARADRSAARRERTASTWCARFGPSSAPATSRSIATWSTARSRCPTN